MKQWKPIEGYEGLYEIANDGTVKSLKRMVDPGNGRRHYEIEEQIFLSRIHKNGYKYISLSKNGKTVTYRTHRLVAIAFIPNPENKSYINHINGIKHDCRVENLEWVTPSENDLHAFKTGLRNSPKVWTGKTGDAHNRSKAVIQITDQCDIRFGSAQEAARQTGIQHQNITKVCLQQRKKAGGYAWKYA